MNTTELVDNISQIYCNYIYTSKELYDMENREASDLEAVRAEKE